MHLALAVLAAWCGTGASNAAESEPPLALRPYRVRLWLDIDRHPRFPIARRAELVRQIADLADRYVGRAWQLEEATAPPGLVTGSAPRPWGTEGPGCDKVLWVRLDSGTGPLSSNRFASSSAAVRVTVREYDARFDDWGPVAQERMAPDIRLAHRIFDRVLSQFRPQAEVLGSPQNARVPVSIRGMGLAPADAPAPFLQPGRPLRLFLEFHQKGELVQRRPVPWSYLVHHELLPDRLSASGDVVSALRFPVPKPSRRLKVMALACGFVEQGQTVVRFVTKDGEDLRPVEGFPASLRSQNQNALLPLGNTDERGEVVVAVAPARQRTGPSQAAVCHVLLRAGQSILAMRPLVPGEQETIEIPVTLDELLIDFDGEVLALQEEMVDAVARRTVLEARMKQLAEKGEAEKLAQAGKELERIPARDHFVTKFERIKNDAQERSQREKRPQLSRAVRRLFSQTDSLLATYFGQEVEEETEEMAEESMPEKKD